MGNLSRKAKPTEADIAAARRLRAEWDARAKSLGLTQDKMAAAMGGTQGLVSQYLRGTIPLNYRALLLFCEALGIDVETVRTDLPEQHLANPRFLSRRSNALRLDADKVATTTRALQIVLARRGSALDLTQLLDAQLFVEAYTELEAMSGSPDGDVTFGAVVTDLVHAREGEKGERTGDPGRSSDEQTGRAARAKTNRGRTTR
jgi:transcriptional regulator with XRE-family HTH domain